VNENEQYRGCGVSAGTTSETAHENSHGREKPFQCSERVKTHTSLSALNHFSVHTGEKSFLCVQSVPKFFLFTLRNSEAAHENAR
jgi:hypothetical protein